MDLDRPRALVRELLADWELTLDGEERHGQCAVVLPVRTSTGEPAALKVTAPHEEAEHEHLALQHWHGTGASGCCAPTRTAGRCSSSGCTPPT